MKTRKVNGASVLVIREALGIAHKDLARRAQISPSSLTRIESGERQASPPVVRRIADSLGVPLESITYPMFAPVGENSFSDEKRVA